MPREAFASSLHEYWYHVSARDVIPIAGETELDANSVVRAHTFFGSFDNENSRNHIANALVSGSVLISDIFPWCGISNKAFYLEMSLRCSRIPNPESEDNSSICKCKPWNITRHQTSFFQNFINRKSTSRRLRMLMAHVVSDYLIERGIVDYIQVYRTFSLQQLEGLNNALIEGAATQSEAKRMGHGAEQRLALLLNNLDCTYMPENKHTNPMAPDQNLNPEDLSFVEKGDDTIPTDLAITDDGRVSMVVLSMIHTSDPGQYGVNKTEKATDYFRYVSSHANVEYCLLLDGVGFTENKTKTIEKLLQHCSMFIQMNTFYKIALKLHEMGLCQIRAIRFSHNYDDEDIIAISEMYVPEDVTVLPQGELVRPDWTEISAGWASIYI